MPANRELLPSDWAIPYAMAGTLAPYLTSCFSQFLFQFTISHSITAFPILIIARIRTCVNKNIRIRTCISMHGEDCESGQHVISDRIPCKIGTSTRRGELRGGGLTFFISELETTPLPCAVCLLHIVGGVDMADLIRRAQG